MSETEIILKAIYMKILSSDDLEDVRLFVRVLLGGDKANSIDMKYRELQERKNLK